MADALSIALSGLMAQGQRMAATANNIANVATVGALPTAGSPESTVYRPLDVSFSALMANNSPAVVLATVTEDANGYTAMFDPSSVYANSEGLVAAPNVSLDKEFISLIETRLAYKANIKVIQAQKEMLGDLLNTIT